MSLTIETRYGRVRGASERGVQTYRGLPYARAPLGPLRFRPPLPPRPWDGVRDCREFAVAAPQNASRWPSLSQGPTRVGENCLCLNIWTPGLDGEPKPVLVWLHGGDFVEGSASEPGLNGRALARRGDLVVVTVQYRLGALGFLDLGLVAPGRANLALLDQIAALEWVRDEIDAFGGDPTNVTLAGSGAGAGCAAALAGMPRARGLFRGAILQSPVLQLWEHEQGTEVARTLLQELGLASTADSMDLDLLPTDQVLAGQRRCEQYLGHASNGRVFRPVVDGAILPKAPIAAAAAGDARSVRLMVGTNLDEARLAAIEDATALDLSESELVARCVALIPGRDRPERARSLIDTYRGARLGTAATPSSIWFAIESDRIFRHPAMQLAQAQAAQGGPVFAYLFCWPSPALGGALGAFHGLEVPFVFGTRRHHSLSRFLEGGDEAKELSHRISDAWIAFARSGDPSSPGLGRWPAYTAPEHKTLMLGAKPEIVDGPLEAERTIWDELGGAQESRT